MAGTGHAHDEHAHDEHAESAEEAEHAHDENAHDDHAESAEGAATAVAVAAPVLELQERLGSALDERLGGTGGLQDTCDDLGYRTLGLGFGLLTLGLISGAVWANEAWGAYWSWDPKETWALITWLVYAIYLHTRLSDEYSQGDSNRVAVAGFVVTWVCYLGVNLFGVGLHSYGFLSS